MKIATKPLLFLTSVVLLLCTAPAARAQVSQQDFATFQTNVQNLVGFLQQTSANDPTQLALANDLQNVVNSLTSDQLFQVASSFNVTAFNNAMTVVNNIQPTQRNPANTDPPSNLFNPNFLICQLVQQLGTAAGQTLVPSDPGTIKALDVSIAVAKVAAITADKLCSGVVVVAGEGTTLPQCIIAQVLDLIAQGLARAKQILTFCDPVVTSAEVEAAWQNTVTIDTDLANHDVNTSNHLSQIDEHLTLIDSELNTHSNAVDTDLAGRMVAVDADIASRLANADTDLSQKLTAVDTDVNGHLNLVDSDLTTRASQIDSEISAFQALDLRLQIERALTTGQVIGLFEIPQSQGGFLELVRSIVVDTINKMLAAGLSVGTASKNLTNGDTARAAGDFKTAFKSYATAYQAAVY
jgi:hypothetical protein